MKIKITKNFLVFNLKHIWIGEKKQQKLYDFKLHCKNAEMTIV